MHAAGQEIDAVMNKLRCMAVSCGMCPLIYAAVICGVYWSWLSKANDFDDKVPNWQSDISAFDTCGGLFEATIASDGSFSAQLIDTKWSVILAFNSYFFLLHAIMTFLVLLGITGILMPCCLLGGCCHCCGGCVHLACIIVTGVYRFSTEGERCAEHQGFLDTDGTKFSELGDAIKSLFIA